MPSYHRPVTRDEAQRRCVELNGQPGAPAARWLAQRERGDEWRVVRVTIPGRVAVHPLKAEVQARPRPSEPPDPRPGVFRDVPPYGASG